MTEVRSHVIGGVPHAPAEGPVLDVLDPATDDVLARIPAGSEADADAAVTAAGAAAADWGRTPPSQRAAAVGSWAEVVRAHAGELAALQARERGLDLARSRR